MERKDAMMTPDIGDKTKSFHAGQSIYKEGQTSNEAYIIKQGGVSLHRLRGNKRINLGQLRPGQIFGEMGVVTGEKRDASAEATEYTEVIVLDQNLLQTLLLKSPRPVQIMTSYLMERVRDLSGHIAERSSANTFSSVCTILLLCHKAALAAKADGKPAPVHLSTVEVSRTIKDALLISQVEIDDILDKLALLHVIEISRVKGVRYRKDPLLGDVKQTGQFVKERLIAIPDAERFAHVTRNMAKDKAQQDLFGSEMEFIDLDDFADAVNASPEILLKKIAYGEIPPQFFFFHKASTMQFARGKGPDYFRRAKRPRLKAEDLSAVDDILGVDDATLQEALSRLGFYKVSVLAALAGDEARDKILRNLSGKIARVVREEMKNRDGMDPNEAADIEEELLEVIKSMKGIGS